MNSLWPLSLGLVRWLPPPKVKPSDILEPEFVRDAPEHSLTLEFVNGFKVEDSRQNMFWGKNKD